MTVVMMLVTRAKFVKNKLNMKRTVMMMMTVTVTVETRGMINKTTTTNKQRVLSRMRNKMRRMRRWARRRSKHIKNTRHPHQNQH